MKHPSQVGGRILVPIRPGAVDQPVVGPDAVRAAASTLLRMPKDWPYDWIYPPENSIRVRQSASIAAPANATQTVVLSYTVPTGYRFCMTHIVQVFTGSGFVAGSGSITWVLDVNVQIGLTTPLGNVVQGFASEVVPLGSFSYGPWPLLRPELFDENDVVRHKVTTTAAITPGAPNYFTSMFLGWLLPAVRG